MVAITTSDFSRTAPRGAVVAADLFVKLLSGLRMLAVQAQATTSEEARRQTLASFPV